MKNDTLPTSTPALRLIQHWYDEKQTIPERMLERAKECLLDALGCGLFGYTQPWGQIMATEAYADGSSGPCTVLGARDTVAPPQAALCNGTSIHGFELDDLLPASIIHAGTVIVPAVLAMAEASNASGARLLRGIVAGYETMARLSLAIGMEPSHRGFHKTAVVGPVAAAIACGVVAGLHLQETICAAGLACSTSSGIKAFAGGSGGGMVKRMHGGRAAEAGVRTSRLAARGFTGPSAAIDGHFGLIDVFAGEAAEPRHLTDGLGDVWALDGLWVKVYPICGWIQGVVQLLVEMRGGGPLQLDRVDKVVVGTSAFAVKNNANVTPTDTMEAQYSIPYCAAVALAGDAADPREYSAPAIHDPERLALARRVVLDVDAESEAVYPARFGSRVELHLANGEVRQATTLDPHGTAADPCSRDELVAKFKRLATQSAPSIDTEAVVTAVARADRLVSIHELTVLLRNALPPRTS
jgi:2-methylcitrate dehydratase PrpD